MTKKKPTRAQIKRKIHANSEKIKALKSEQIELNRAQLLLTDKSQQYRESEETHGRGKNKETALIGRVYWKEKFIDEDYPNNPKDFVIIERSCVVRKNNEWINGY